MLEVSHANVGDHTWMWTAILRMQYLAGTAITMVKWAKCDIRIVFFKTINWYLLKNLRQNICNNVTLKSSASQILYDLKNKNKILAKELLLKNLEESMKFGEQKRVV